MLEECYKNKNDNFYNEIISHNKAFFFLGVLNNVKRIRMTTVILQLDSTVNDYLPVYAVSM